MSHRMLSLVKVLPSQYLKPKIVIHFLVMCDGALRSRHMAFDFRTHPVLCMAGAAITTHFGVGVFSIPIPTEQQQQQRRRNETKLILSDEYSRSLLFRCSSRTSSFFTADPLDITVVVQPSSLPAVSIFRGSNHKIRGVVGVSTMSTIWQMPLTCASRRGHEL